MRIRRIVVLGLIATIGCSDGGTAPERLASPAHLEIHAGNNQEATVGTPVPVAPAVVVRNADREPLPDILVEFRIIEGGGSLSEKQQRTNAEGIASISSWVLGTRAGVNRMTATVSGLSPVTFVATALPGEAKSIQVVAGNEQRAVAGSTLTQPLSVRLRDAYDNPVPNVEVTWTVAAGNGSVSPAVSRTNTAGEAKTTWTLGDTPGPNTVVASVLGLDPVIFTATGTHPPLVIVRGNRQTGLMLSTLPESLAVRLVNDDGEPQAGVPVRFVLGPERLSSLENTNPSTDAEGYATAGRWRLGLAPGIQTVKAIVDGVGEVVFEATARGTIEWFSAVDIAMGGDHYCGLHEDGTTYCWGANWGGALGDSTTNHSPTPVQVRSEVQFKSISVGSAHTCGLTETGEAYCWGSNTYGQLGDGTRTGRLVPVRVQGGQRFREIAAGALFTCAITFDNEAYCWGANDSGQLGNETRTSSSVPVPVAGNIKFKAIAVTKAANTAGRGWTCGLDLSNKPYCWGNNAWGQLGDGTKEDRLSPTPVQGGFTFESIAVGLAVCGITDTGTAYCWGSNRNGQIGDGTQDDRMTPTRVKSDVQFTSIHVNEMHACGLSESRIAYCWGYNLFGQLGIRNAPAAFVIPEPRIVDEGSIKFKKIDTGRTATCGITPDNAVYCWGPNSGEEGTSPYDPRHSVPVRVYWRILP